MFREKGLGDPTVLTWKLAVDCSFGWAFRFAFFLISYVIKSLYT
ncbi:MAG: hypothetical protein ACFCD0_23170 [Gemmataceae bacterium]